MVDFLVAWGVTQAVGFAFKPILEDLAKDATKDFAKDFLKDSLKHVLLTAKEPLDIAGNLIRADNLEGILTEYLKTILDSNSRVVARLMIEQLRTRNFILCYLGADYYAFVHRTFLEYFCAWEFVWQFKETQKLKIEELKTEVFGKHWQDESWHEVLRLIVGMIDERFAGEVIDYLMEQDGELAMFSNLFLASKCLSEVKSYFNIQTIAERLLNKLKNLTKDELNYDYRKSIDEENTKLPRGISTQDVLMVITTSVRSAAVRELARGWKDDPETLPILKARLQSDSQPAVRQAAVQELVRGWKDDPNTLTILKTSIQFDDDFHVRIAAMEELARDWKDDPNTLAILKTRALSDDNGLVRMAAMEELARRWKDNPDTLPWLQTCALSDEDWEVRMVAMKELVRGWKDDPETLAWFKTCALSNDNLPVRYAAVRELARGWKDEPWMFEFLYDRALNDPFERKEDREDNPRQTALEAIIRQYPDHPQTLPLCKDRAENDLDEKVKEFAQKKLAKLEE